MPGIVLDIGNSAVNKKTRFFFLIGLKILMGRDRCYMNKMLKYVNDDICCKKIKQGSKEMDGWLMFTGEGGQSL